MTKHILVLALASVLGAGACKAKPEDKAADNTAQNARDKNAVPTADQAGQGKSDVDVMASIRKSIMDDGSLSTNAHNCKVIANKGVVTLAGPVASADEKAKVEKLATSVAGVTQVINQLEVAN
ncbi:MAG TPA: BON domain-containing protein [Kofleriaceae bacterium]